MAGQTQNETVLAMAACNIELHNNGGGHSQLPPVKGTTNDGGFWRLTAAIACGQRVGVSGRYRRKRRMRRKTVNHTRGNRQISAGRMTVEY
jgi:hypothetical protein